MASSNPNLERDEGFATPAAAAISLAIATVAAAVTVASVQALRFERSELARSKAQYALAGGQTEAALVLMGSRSQGPTRFRVAAGGQSAEVIAEPEAEKLGLVTAAALGDAELARLGAMAPSHARADLAALADAKGQAANRIVDADASQAWRLCARSFISPYGAASRPPSAIWTWPQPNGAVSRTGQLWRIRVAHDGWVDDRVVRFTGSRDHPLAVAADAFGRGREMGDACDSAFQAAPRAWAGTRATPLPRCWWSSASYA
jgi:hypothetical protein